MKTHWSGVWEQGGGRPRPGAGVLLGPNTDRQLPVRPSSVPARGQRGAQGLGRTRTLLGASTKPLEQRRLPRQLTGTPKSTGSLNLSRMRTLAPEPGRGPPALPGHGPPAAEPAEDAQPAWMQVTKALVTAAPTQPCCWPCPVSWSAGHAQTNGLVAGPRQGCRGQRGKQALRS